MRHLPVKKQVLLVRAAIDAIGDKVGTNPAIVKQCVALRRRAIAIECIEPGIDELDLPVFGQLASALIAFVRYLQSHTFAKVVNAAKKHTHHHDPEILAALGQRQHVAAASNRADEAQARELGQQGAAK